MITAQEIKDRVNYHPPNEEAKRLHGVVRKQIEETMLILAASVPEGREHSTMLTKIEEAMFWANAGIARNHDLLAVTNPDPS